MSLDRDWLRDLFEPFGEISIRRLFSGAGLYRDGVMFALATSDGGIYLKSDAETEPRFREAGSQRFTYGRDRRKIAMSYWSLPEAALDDGEALKEWAELALQAALRQPEKPKRSRNAKPGAAKEGARRSPRTRRSRRSSRKAASSA